VSDKKPAGENNVGRTAGPKRKWTSALTSNGALLGLLVLSVLLSLTSPAFLSVANLTNIGIQTSVVAILAFGMTFVIITAGIDLSVGSLAALAAVSAGWAGTVGGFPPIVALIMGLFVGMAGGLVNGILVAFGKIPAFIATLAMLSIGRGLTLVISDGTPISTSGPITFLGSRIGEWLPVPILVMIVMGIIASIILNKTLAGRTMFAIGGNQEAARLSGLAVRRNLLYVYVLAGLFAGVAGMVLAGRLSSAQPQAASGYELDAIAAVIIGGASLFGGVGTISGTLIGALVLAVIRNGLNLLNVNPFWQQVAIGVVIALAVLVDSLRRRYGSQ
jgi:ribose transport system permease protein